MRAERRRDPAGRGGSRRPLHRRLLLPLRGRARPVASRRPPGTPTWATPSPTPSGWSSPPPSARWTGTLNSRAAAVIGVSRVGAYGARYFYLASTEGGRLGPVTEVAFGDAGDVPTLLTGVATAAAPPRSTDPPTRNPVRRLATWWTAVGRSRPFRSATRATSWSRTRLPRTRPGGAPSSSAARRRGTFFDSRARAERGRMSQRWASATGVTAASCTPWPGRAPRSASTGRRTRRSSWPTPGPRVHRARDVGGLRHPRGPGAGRRLGLEQRRRFRPGRASSAQRRVSGSWPTPRRGSSATKPRRSTTSRRSSSATRATRRWPATRSSASGSLRRRPGPVLAWAGASPASARDAVLARARQGDEGTVGQQLTTVEDGADRHEHVGAVLDAEPPVDDAPDTELAPASVDVPVDHTVDRRPGRPVAPRWARGRCRRTPTGR